MRLAGAGMEPHPQTCAPGISEEQAEEWLARLRWRHGFTCPRCPSRSATRLRTRGLWQCQACRHQTSVTAGTRLHRTRLPLSTIAYAIWMVASRKQSISALQLQKDCHIGSYESAWTLLHRIRQTLVERDETPLRGPDIEVHEPIIEHGDGVRPASPHRRQTVVGIAIERWRSPGSQRSKAGRIRIWPHISDIHVTFAFLERVLGQTSPRNSGGLLARTLAANLMAWLNGTFHGVSDKYMFAYVREYVFRFNRRRRERILPAIVATALLRAPPKDVASLRDPSDLEYPLSAA